MPQPASNPDTLARACAEALRARDTAADWMGIEILEASAGLARLRMTVRGDMLNGHATCHGGILFALADTAFAFACNGRNETTVAQHAMISYLAPAREGDVLTAEARVGAQGGRSGLTDVTLRNAAGDTIAEFRGMSRTIGGAVITE